MKIARLSEVKDNLARYVRYVREGGRVRILVRNRPVAELIPVSTPSFCDDPQDSHLRDLERRGIVRRGSGAAPADLLKVGPRARGGRALSEIVIEERRSGR